MKSPHFLKPGQGIWAKKFTHAHYVFPPWRGLPVQSSLAPSRPRRFRMWRHLPSLSGKFAKETSRYHTRFQASSGNSDSANWPGYEAVFSHYWIVLFEKDEKFSENGINQRFKKHGLRISTKKEKGAAQTTMPHCNECVLISNENSYEQFLQHPCFVQYLQKTNTPEEMRMLRNDTASFSFSTFNLV